jgi:hypothetical protein
VSSLSFEKHDEQVGNSKSSDEYDMLERKLIHPMTMVSKMGSTFQNMI